MPTPQDKSAKIADLSKFKEDHPDYAGMTTREKKRAIVRLLRHCNFCVSQIAMKKSEINALRSGLPSPQDFSKYGMQAIHSGIAWVRCTSTVQEGEPVCFDSETGNSVRKAPVTNISDDVDSNPSSAGLVRTEHSDMFYVVGYAVSSPELVKDHYEVAVQFVKQNPILEYARLVADWDGFTEQSGVAEGEYQELDEAANWAVQPNRLATYDLSGAPWREMGITGWRWVFNSSDEEAGWYYIEGDMGAARVINPYPFGFYCRRFYVTQSGDDYVIDRPESTNDYPACAIVGGGFKEATSIGGGPGSGGTSYIDINAVSNSGGGAGGINNSLYLVEEGASSTLTSLVTQDSGGCNGICIGTLWIKDVGSSSPGGEKEYLFSKQTSPGTSGYTGAAELLPPSIEIENSSFLGSYAFSGGGGGSFHGKINHSIFEQINTAFQEIAGVIGDLNYKTDLIAAQIRSCCNPTFNPASASWPGFTLDSEALADVYVSGLGYYAVPFCVPVNVAYPIRFKVTWPNIGATAGAPAGQGWTYKMVAKVTLFSM